MTETEELAKLRGEKAVLIALLTECAGVISNVDPESQSEFLIITRLLADICSAQSGDKPGELL